MRVARYRVTSMSANQRTKCSASFSRAGRSVTLSPRSNGPNMEAARIAAHAGFLLWLEKVPTGSRRGRSHLSTDVLAEHLRRSVDRVVDGETGAFEHWL